MRLTWQRWVQKYSLKDPSDRSRFRCQGFYGCTDLPNRVASIAADCDPPDSVSPIGDPVFGAPLSRGADDDEPPTGGDRGIGGIMTNAADVSMVGAEVQPERSFRSVQVQVPGFLRLYCSAIPGYVMGRWL